jgi:hypothetical protein
MTAIDRLTAALADVAESGDDFYTMPCVHAADLADVLAVVVIAKEHGQCSCAALTSGEGPRPIGNGRFYHFQGCDYDEYLTNVLAKLEDTP